MGFKKGLDLLNDRRRFGQGNRHLSSVFAHLMVLAFLIDQIELRCSGLFRDALVRTKQIKYFREKARNMSREFIIDSWEVLYSVIVGDTKFAHELIHLSGKRSEGFKKTADRVEGTR